MGKGKRIRASRSHKDIEFKREQLAMEIELINKKMQIKWHESLRIKIYYYLCRLKVQHISRRVYDTFLTYEKKWFRRIAYTNYAEGLVFKNFADFHMVMMTRCDINNADWTKYISNKGGILREYYDDYNGMMYITTKDGE